MKKQLLIITLLLPLFIQSAEVDSVRALTVAQNFAYESFAHFRSQTYESINPSIQYIMYDDDSMPLLFFINVEPYGSMIISGDDRAYPVLSHSDDGKWEEGFWDLIAPGENYFINEYATQIGLIRKYDIKTNPEVTQLWNRYEDISNLILTLKSQKELYTMGNILWDIGKYYNAEYPKTEGVHPLSGDEYDNRCLVGCGQVALSQLLRYWMWPNKGYGSNSYVDPANSPPDCPYYDPSYGTRSANFGNTSYLWDDMPYSISSYNNNIATAIYHSAVAANADLSYCNTWSEISDRYDAFTDNFRFSTNAVLRSKSILISWSTWEGYLVNDIDNGRPIHYSGRDGLGTGSAGHALICYAYINMGTYYTFKFNWGGGYYSSTWYTLRAMPNELEFLYPVNQKMINNLYPDGSNVSPCSNIISINGTGSSHSKSFMGGGIGAWNTTTNNACGYKPTGVEKVFSFVPTVTGVYSIQVTQADGWVDYMWKSGSCSSSGWNCLASIASSGTYGSMNWTAGTTYFILLDDENSIPGLHTFYINPPTLPPTITLTPSTYNYGSFQIGECSNEVSFTLKNIGDGTATGNVAITYTNADQFNITSGGGSFSLTANQTKTIKVRFCPTSGGNKYARLSANGTGNTNSLYSFLEGYGASPPNISLSPSSKNFGSVTHPDCSSEQSFSLSNSGGSVASGNVTISGTHSSQFIITSGGGSFSLNPGSNKTIKVRFCPNSPAGSKTANLNANGSGTTNNASSTLTGTCVMPANITLSPSSKNFGSILVGNCSPQETFILENEGSAPVSGYVELFYGSHYNITSGGGNFSLSPNATKTIKVEFCPTSTGTKTDYLEVYDNSNNFLTDSYLNGQGVQANLSVTPNSLNFGNVTVGQCHTLNYTLTGNNLTTNVTVTTPSGYQVSTSPGSGFANSITVTQSGGNVNQIIYVRFCPTAAQSYSGNVINSSTGATTQNVSVSGTGVVDPVLAVNPGSLSFGSLPVGQCAILNYTLTGNNLTTNVIITVSAGFQVSTQPTSGFTGSITVPQSGGNVNQPIYVRFCCPSSDVSGNVTNASTGAATKLVSVNGSCLPVTGPSLGITHQAVIRNAANELVANSPIGTKVSILRGSAEGTVVYSETHNPESNTNGLISFIIGQGTAVSGLFASINWASGPYFIKTEADPAGGTNYTINGTSQMLSVPYVLEAKHASSLTLSDDSGNKYQITVDENGNLIANQVAQPWQCGHPFTDTRDGKTYNTVEIGTQCWMKENLKYLPSVVGPGTGSETEPYYYVYDYNGTDVNAAKATANYQNYGVLYNWPASLIACPSGWHLPSVDEWGALITFLSDQPAYLCNANTENIAKSLAATTNWNTSTYTCAVGNNLSANNATGFSGLPGGSRYIDGSFYEIGYYGDWWTSTEFSNSYVVYYFMVYGAPYVPCNANTGSYGHSARCVRD